MQDDDTANPGMLWVLDGEALWQRQDGAAGKSCADCHGDAATSMKGVAARYPAFDAALGRPVDLEQKINQCRTERQQARALPVREQGAAGADRLCRAPVARRADRDRRRCADRGDSSMPAAPSSSGARVSSTSPAPSATTTIGASARRLADPAGASDRVSALSPRMADPRLAAAAPAQLHDRHARRALCLRVGGECRARAVPRVARAGDGDGGAGG